ncbi:PREDICTED: phosphatidylinositol 3,4,5-trisphosphate 3-phosphatase TPTE2 [Dipodomys ordii]|uniref:Phosphatidylinositol 3,4,5-trisphosphate 3-phosphatase TPTE2 n=1 Tax=Dipodomys ordii TaxID=10020 RepID=A0A1S3ETL5_DIPOR|nr:PREDICTED: phosphatidylinositol 3,4,5-trisphosphate 3-phosphatase TPTE2 [Dipodomys ordii]
MGGRPGWRSPAVRGLGDGALRCSPTLPSPSRRPTWTCAPRPPTRCWLQASLKDKHTTTGHSLHLLPIRLHPEELRAKHLPDSGFDNILYFRLEHGLADLLYLTSLTQMAKNSESLAGNARIIVGFNPEYKTVIPRRQNGDERLRVIHATTDTRINYPENEQNNDNSTNEGVTTGPEKTEPLEIILQHVNKSDTDTRLDVVNISNNNLTTSDTNAIPDVFIHSSSNVTTGDTDSIPDVVINSGNNVTTGMEANKAGDLILQDVSESDTDSIPDVVIHSGNNLTTDLEENKSGGVILEDASIRLEEIKTGDLVLEDFIESDTNAIPDVVIDSGNQVTTESSACEILSDYKIQLDQEDVKERLFGILLLFIDVGLVVTEPYIPMQLQIVSLAIAIFFFINVLLQVYIEGEKYYFSDLLNIFDTVIIGITLCINITSVVFEFNILTGIPRLTVVFRPIRLITLLRLFHLANQIRHLEQSTRRMVSGNKRRYNKDGFDIDLTYITERMIAMSFPASGRLALYRNPIEEVTRFLDTKHFGHYFVYNLCSEKSYNPLHFHNRMHRIMIDDHNVPSLEEMIQLSKDIVGWLDLDPQNVAALHCKGGKGRTGTMICACLIATGIFSTAKESLKWFGCRRTDFSRGSKFQGVETPSQSRYVEYFETVQKIFNWSLPPQRTVKITKIVIYSIHGVGRGDGTDLKIDIIMHREIIFSSTPENCVLQHDVETNRAIILILDCPNLHADIKVKFSSPIIPNYYDDCAFFFWFNTALIKRNRLYLTHNELDNLHKPKTWGFYPTDFAVELYFEEVVSLAILFGTLCLNSCYFIFLYILRNPENKFCITKYH